MTPLRMHVRSMSTPELSTLFRPLEFYRANLLDRGRRFGMSLGAAVIIIGVIIQGTCVHTHSVHQFMGGRFFMGLGVQLVSSAGPCYVVEISHPAYRGTVTALYNVFW
jgi:fucose permease